MLPSDSREEALRKETLVLSAAVITALAVVWVGTYWALGLYLSAIIPFAYQVVSVVNLVVLARTKRYRFFRASELALSLMLPFLLQLSLGGFVASSGVVLWSFTAPLGALLFSGRKEAARWFAAFLAVVALCVALDPFLVNKTGEIPHWIRISFFALNVLGVTGTCYLLLHYFVTERDRAAAMVAAERERSERLLLNVLPGPIAERLKSGESLIADGSPEVGVLFADIAGFTPLSATMAPEDIVGLLNEVFTVFDGLAAEHGLEKIKTIGDAYMVASGLLGGGQDHLQKLARMALGMQGAVESMGSIQLRIGIDVGPVVAGVIGRRKFIYDLWGDTVNTASRMESHGVPGAIHVTERAQMHLASTFEFEDRGILDVKGKGPMRTYLLLGPKNGRPAAGDASTSMELGTSRGVSQFD
ncbi:MAG: adenylate/guanylate cyclase domain-containing protein [Actinomycetota bacterium]|nr:adenylate/guanylate cyclase domain-containing protein [Actinomycetota bacterium]